MATTSKTKREFQTAARLALMAASVALLTVSSLFYASYATYGDAVDLASAQVSELASVMADDVGHGVQAVELALANAVEIVGGLSPEELASEAGIKKMRRDLAQARHMLDFSQVIAIANAEGVVIAGSDEIRRPPVVIADREYFTTLRDGSARGLAVSRPLISRANGELTLFFARRIDGPGGVFRGVALVGVAPSRLLSGYSRMAAKGEHIFSLLYADGTVALREPPTPELIGKIPDRLDLWRAAAAKGGGIYHSSGALDPQPKYVAVRQVGALPLFVNAAITDAAALGQWRLRSLAVAAAGLVGYGLIVALIYWQMRLNGGLSRSRLRSWARARRLAVKQQELDAARRRLALTLDSVAEGLAIYDRDDRLVVSNRSYAELYGLCASDLKLGMTFREVCNLRLSRGIFGGETPASYSNLMGGDRNGDYTLRFSHGRVLRLRGRKTPGGDWLTLQEDVTDRFEADERLAYAAAHDALTGLINRAAFNTQLTERLQRDPSARFALLLIDIDGFKEVNDTYGHEIGDRVLIGLAERLGEQPEVEVLARLGGDEFALVSATTASAAALLAARLIEAGRRPFNIDGRFIVLDISVGVYGVEDGECEGAAVLRRADLALSAAKEAGRNGFKLFDATLERRYLDRYELARDLKMAVERDELDVHYQPIYDRCGERIICMEALARWRHPTRGLIAPGVFIPIAEAAGLIVDLGDGVLSRALRDAALWREDIVVAVNVSALQAERPDFADKVARALGTLPPRRLQLEITESILLRVDDALVTTMQRLRDLGVTFALDDFGAGYASLAYLKAFPVDKIKIDRAFVKDIDADAHSVAIVAAVVALARSFDIPTTAEGVETRAQFDALKALGVDSLQGFYFSKPRPIEAFERNEISPAESAAA